MDHGTYNEHIWDMMSCHDMLWDIHEYMSSHHIYSMIFWLVVWNNHIYIFHDPGSSKWSFQPSIRGHLTPFQGHLIASKGSLWRSWILYEISTDKLMGYFTCNRNFSSWISQIGRDKLMIFFDPKLTPKEKNRHQSELPNLGIRQLNVYCTVYLLDM